MLLSGLFLYPIKSVAPLAVGEARVERRGLAQDRRWMIVDGEGRFLTGRELPRLVLVRACPTAGGLALEAPGMPPLQVGVPAGEGTPVTIWRSMVMARPAGTAADAWLSAFLGQSVHLVHMPDAERRAADPEFSKPGDEVSFADGYPALLISQAALDGLNARLAQPVSMLRFRPNLVVDGAAAHAEDGWKRIRVGEVAFDVVKPCSRCVFTTIDPERGERDPGGEPLRTLARYRRIPGGVAFGQNLIPRGSGTVRVGDPVVIMA